MTAVSRAATPSKSKDNLGVATPDMIEQLQSTPQPPPPPPAQRASSQGLASPGIGLHYRPLSKANLQEKLLNECVQLPVLIQIHKRTFKCFNSIFALILFCAKGLLILVYD